MDQRDFEMLRDIIREESDRRALQTEKLIEGTEERLSQRIEETNERMTGMEERLNQRIEETNNRITETNERMTGMEKRLDQRIKETNERITETEYFLVDEIGRVQDYLEEKINTVQKNVDELRQYYSITKLEENNTTLILRIVGELKEDVDLLKEDVNELKQKTA